MNHPKQKAFIYIRRSQERQDRQILSIEGQRAELKKVIEENDLAPIWLPAEERSAHSPGRPIFNEMMERIEAGEARIIVTWMPNRLSRNPKDGGDILWALSSAKILKIITPARTYRDNKDDIFFLNLEFGMSKMYSDEISVNVRRGYKAKYERGEYPTHAPIGYINVVIGSNKNIAPDPEKAPLVIRLFEEAATGKYTLDQVYKLARHELHLTTRKGRPLPKSTISDILKKSLYYGVFFHGGEYHLGSYKPLITKDLFDAVQLAMGWASRRQRNSTSGRYYPFKGPLVCGGCGFNITAYTKPKTLKKTGEKVEYVFYSCTRKSKQVKCKEPQIAASELEKLMLAEISRIKLGRDDAKECLRLLRHYHQEQVNNRNTMLNVWQKDAKEARTKLNHLLEMRLNNEIDSDMFNEHKARYESVLVRTKELINDADHNAEHWLELAEEFFSDAVNIVDTFNIATDQEKQKILLELGSNWTLTDKKVQFTPRKLYDLLVNRTSSSDWRARPDSNRRSSP